MHNPNIYHHIFILDLSVVELNIVVNFASVIDVVFEFQIGIIDFQWISRVVDDDVVRYELYGFIGLRLQNPLVILFLGRTVPLIDCVHHGAGKLLADTQVQIIR